MLKRGSELWCYSIDAELLEIARCLRADYEALLEPVPPRFADIERARLTWIKAKVRELFLLG
jgi:hypothetical protein